MSFSPLGSARSAAPLALLCLVVGLAACTQTPFGRMQLSLIPEAELESQATALYDQMLTEMTISKDEAKRNFVLCVSNAVTTSLPAGSPTRWQVTLFEDDTANAFALPGGKIGVHTGLLKVAQNQHQLAAVIGHEVAHVLERHASARASNQAALQVVIGTTAAATIQDPEQQAAAVAMGLGLSEVGVLMPFSRSDESIADKFGLDLISDAGFDPRESVQLWRNMAAASQGQPIEFLSTHPSHSTRIADLSRRIPKAMVRYQRAQEAGRRPHCK